MSWREALVFGVYSAIVFQVGRVAGKSEAWSKAYSYEARQNAILRDRVQKLEEK
jgi:hypothetical protein